MIQMAEYNKRPSKAYDVDVSESEYTEVPDILTAFKAILHGICK